MQLKTILYICIVALFFACNPNLPKIVTPLQEQQVNKQENQPGQQQNLPLLTNKQYIQNLQGTWAENKNENAAFMIEGDTIVFTENISHPYKFVISKDTLVFKYPEGLYKMCILKATKDSLIMNDEGVISRYYNRGKK